MTKRKDIYELFNTDASGWTAAETKRVVEAQLADADHSVESLLSWMNVTKEADKVKITKAYNAVKKAKAKLRQSEVAEYDAHYEKSIALGRSVDGTCTIMHNGAEQVVRAACHDDEDCSVKYVFGFSIHEQPHIIA